MSPLEKAPGATGCSHCQGLGARQVCALCGAPVCADCGAAPRSCPRPGVRELKLGLASRLRDVDPGGQVGLVSSWRQQGRVMDLYTGEVLVPNIKRQAQVPWPALVDREHLAWAEIKTVNQGLVRGVRFASHGGEAAHFLPVEAALFRALTTTSDGKLLLVLRQDESVDVVQLAERRLLGNYRLGDQVIHWADADLQLGLLAAGTYGKVAFFRLADGRLLGHCRVDRGNVDWLGLAGRQLVTVTENGVLEALQVDLDRAPEQWEAAASAMPGQLYLPRLRWTREAGADLAEAPLGLSRDGTLLAAGQRLDGRSVVVLRGLPASPGTDQLLQGHTDRIRLVRFVDHDRFLVTADNDARVKVWPLRNGRAAQD